MAQAVLRDGPRAAAAEALTESVRPGQSLWRLPVPLPAICVWRSHLHRGQRGEGTGLHGQRNKRATAALPDECAQKCESSMCAANRCVGVRRGRGAAAAIKRAKDKRGVGERWRNHIAPKLHKRPLTATARRVRTYTALLESFRKGGSPPKSLLSSLLSDNAMRDGRLKTPRRARRVPVRRYERVGPCYVSLFSVLSLSAGCISLLLRDESSGGSGVYPPVPTGTVAALVFGIYGYRIFQ